MNDHQAAVAILRPLTDHWLFGNVVTLAADGNRDALFLIFDAASRPELSSGECALIDIAHCVYRWKPISFTGLGAMQADWRSHVLAVLAERVGASTPVGAPAAIGQRGLSRVMVVES